MKEVRPNGAVRSVHCLARFFYKWRVGLSATDTIVLYIIIRRNPIFRTEAAHLAAEAEEVEAVTGGSFEIRE